MRDCREILKSIVKDCQEKLKNIVADCREILNNIVKDSRKLEGHRKKFTKERAEHGEGLPGEVGKCETSYKYHKIVVTDAMTRVDDNETGTVINVVEQKSSFSEFENEQKQIEKIVTEHVEKVVTHAHSVRGVLWRHQSHVAKRRSHIRRSHNCKAIPFCSTRPAHLTSLHL